MPVPWKKKDSVPAGSEGGKAEGTRDEATEEGWEGIRKATVAAAATAAIFCRTAGRLRRGGAGHSTYGSGLRGRGERRGGTERGDRERERERWGKGEGGLWRRNVRQLMHC